MVLSPSTMCGTLRTKQKRIPLLGVSSFTKLIMSKSPFEEINRRTNAYPISRKHKSKMFVVAKCTMNANTDYSLWEYSI